MKNIDLFDQISDLAKSLRTLCFRAWLALQLSMMPLVNDIHGVQLNNQLIALLNDAFKFKIQTQSMHLIVLSNFILTLILHWRRLDPYWHFLKACPAFASLRFRRKKTSSYCDTDQRRIRLTPNLGESEHTEIDSGWRAKLVDCKSDWRRSGQRFLPNCMLPTFKHPESVMVGGCFSDEGVGRLRFLPKSR